MKLTTILIIVFGLLFIVAVVFSFGFLVNLLLPRRTSAKGDKVHIFLDGIYNRDATITGIGQEKIMIYETLPLPLTYRGKFYGVGTDRDGVEFWYMADKRLYWLVPFAERIRKRYKLIDCPFNFQPEELPIPAEFKENAENEVTETVQGSDETTEGKDDEG